MKAERQTRCQRELRQHQQHEQHLPQCRLQYQLVVEKLCSVASGKRKDQQ